MAKTNHQKEKLLVLLEILRTESDETHPLVVPRLIEKLQARGIAAERKSIYDDLDTLRRKGYDIVLHRGKGYYLGEREFQLAELKLLVDAVQSSRFITAKKSNELIEKLERQTSIYGAQTLQRQVFVAGRVKSMNESVYYNIDAIHKAIGENRQITFRYFDYDQNLKKVFRHNGKRYRVSPYALLRSDENYYLTAYDSRAEQIKHYRVDKMVEINVTDRRRDGAEAYQSFDLGEYARIHFGMFKGEEPGGAAALRQPVFPCDCGPVWGVGPHGARGRQPLHRFGAGGGESPVLWLGVRAGRRRDHPQSHRCGPGHEGSAGAGAAELHRDYVSVNIPL